MCDDDGGVSSFEFDDTEAEHVITGNAFAPLKWVPAVWSWISTTREITVEDAFRFWAKIHKERERSQTLVGRDVRAEDEALRPSSGMLVIPSRFASEQVISDAGGLCGELQDVQDSEFGSTCFVKWLCSGTKSGPYNLPDQWMEEPDASLFQLALPSDAEKEKSMEYANEVEYERSMAETRRTQLISKWGRLAEKALFRIDLLVRRMLRDQRADQEERKIEKERVWALQQDQLDLLERMERAGVDVKETNEYKDLVKQLKSMQSKKKGVQGKKKARTFSLRRLRKVLAGEKSGEESDSESSDEDEKKPGHRMKVIIPKPKLVLERRPLNPIPGPFPGDVCCRLLEQNELFCLPSVCQRLITNDHDKASSVLQFCSYRATSPSGQHKAFPLRKALEDSKCCLLVVRGCTDETLLKGLFDELEHAFDAALEEEDSGGEVNQRAPSRAFSRVASRRGFSRMSSHMSAATQRSMSRLGSRVPRMPSHASSAQSSAPQALLPPTRRRDGDSGFTRRPASEELDNTGKRQQLAEPSAAEVRQRGREGSRELSQEAVMTAAERKRRSTGGKKVLEMLMLQRVDLLKLHGMRRLLTLLQHEACRIEALVCIRSRVGEEGARLLGKALRGKRTCEEGSSTPIPGVTLGWQHMRRDDAFHDGREDLGLKTLVLQQCELGEKAATSLGQALLGNCTMTTLDLGGNHIGKAGVQALSIGLGFSLSLEHLGLHGNSVGPAEMKLLEEAVAHRWETVLDFERHKSEWVAIQQGLADAARSAAAAGSITVTHAPASTTATVAPAQPDAPAEEAMKEQVEPKAFKLVTGSMEMPVIVRMLQPAAEEQLDVKPVRGMRKLPALPRWTPLDKQWRGIMEWQVKQRGWEEGRQGASLVPPQAKADRRERRALQRHAAQGLEADAARRELRAGPLRGSEHIAEGAGGAGSMAWQEPKSRGADACSGTPQHLSPPRPGSSLEGAAVRDSAVRSGAHAASVPGEGLEGATRASHSLSEMTGETLMSGQDTALGARSEELVSDGSVSLDAGAWLKRR